MTNLINFERTWRIVVCLNPKHETVKFSTNKVGVICCPTCNEIMVTVVKRVFDMDEYTDDSFEE